MWVRKFRQENTEKKCQNNYYHICYIVTELTSFTKKHILIELKWEVVIVNLLLASIISTQWKLLIYCQKTF